VVYHWRLADIESLGVAENALVILANRFQVILGTVQHKSETVKLIVKTSLVLHNLMKVRYPTVQNQQLDQPKGPEKDFVPGI
jgi:hypothetical protein